MNKALKMKCAKCSGFVIQDGADSVRCVNCGWYQVRPVTPVMPEIPPARLPRRPAEPAPVTPKSMKDFVVMLDARERAFERLQARITKLLKETATPWTQKKGRTR